MCSDAAMQRVIRAVITPVQARASAGDDALTSCTAARAAVLFESEESLLRDAVKRRQTADCEQELSARLRQESGYYYQDPFESRRD